MAIAASRFFALAPEEVTPGLESAFFSSLKTGNATFKKTSPNRFSEVDMHLMSMLDGLSLGREVQILDVGISAGTTTLELAIALQEAAVKHRIVATDRSFSAFIVPGPLGSRALLEPSGHILQYEIFGQPVRSWDRRLDRFTGRSLVNAFLRRSFASVSADFLASGEATKVRLVSPRVQSSSSITLEEDNVLLPNPHYQSRFDFIRAANILNRDYFSEDELREALKNLRAYLTGPGAMMLVIRTDKRDGTNNGTLFQMSDRGKLIPVAEYGRGSEVASLVTED